MPSRYQTSRNIIRGIATSTASRFPWARSVPRPDVRERRRWSCRRCFRRFLSAVKQVCPYCSGPVRELDA